MKVRADGAALCCLVLVLLGWAGTGWGADANTVLAGGGTVAVYDTGVEGFLTDKNTQFGKNLLIDGTLVSDLLADLGLSALDVGLPGLKPSDLIGDVIDALDVKIGIGGGEGRLGGGGGGGLDVNLLPGGAAIGDSGPRDGGFYGGLGTELNIAGLGVGLVAGGGGGLTQGGTGFALGDKLGGGGGGLGIDDGALGMSGGVADLVSNGTSFTMNNGTLDIFGGSGGGGGLLGLDLGVVGDALTEILGLLKPLLPSLTVDVNALLTSEAGTGKTVDAVTVGGTGIVNVLGGVGGGGGLLLDSDGAEGTGSTVTNLTLSSGGVVNVYGGAGGGANALLLLSTDGGDGGGGTVGGGSMSGGTLNIYSGADGGDVSAGLLGIPSLLDGAGGAGGGGHVGLAGGFTVTGGVMNLYAGTNAGDKMRESMVVDYGGGAATANNITLDTSSSLAAGEIHLYGGQLTGTYTQRGAGSALYLSGGGYNVDNGGGEFAGGWIYSTVAGSEVDGAKFTGVVRTDAATGDLNISNAVINNSLSDLTIGTNVTLDFATLSQGRIVIDDDGALAGKYAQTGGTLVLSGGDTATVDGSVISGGVVQSDMAGGVLNNITFTGVGSGTGGVVDAGVIGAAGNTLLITGAEIQGGVVLKAGGGVTLEDTAHSAGTVRLGAAGTLGDGYALQGGVVEVAGAGGLVDDGAVFQAGAVQSTAAGGVLTGGTFGVVAGSAVPAGVVAKVAGAGSTLTLSGATVATGGALEAQAGVTLDDFTVSGGEVTLGVSSGLSGVYAQTGGELVFDGGVADIDSGSVISGGAVTSVVSGAVLDGMRFGGSGVVSADAAGTGYSLAITGASIDAGATLGIGENVSIGATAHSSGTVLLGAGGSLGTGYALLGGTLALGSDGGGAGNAAAGITFQTGAINSNVSGGKIVGGTFGLVAGSGVAPGKVVAGVGGAGSSLVISGASVVANGALEAGSGVVLDGFSVSGGEVMLSGTADLSGNYVQTGGKLVLNGGGIGGADKATFSGGSIEARTGVDAVLDGAYFTGGVSTGATGAGGLLITGAHIESGGAVEILSKVSLDDGTLNAGGEITLGGGSLTGDYVQNGGELHLNLLGETARVDASGGTGTFHGGLVTADTTSTLGGAVVAAGGMLTATAAGNQTLTLDGVTLGAGGTLNVGADGMAAGAGVVLKRAVHDGGVIVLNEGGALAGNFAQSAGELVLAGGSAGTGVVTLSGGVVRSDVAAGEIAVGTINGGVTLRALGGNVLTVTGAEILGTAGLAFDGGVVLKNTDLTGGVLVLDANVDLAGTYAQGAGGTLVLDGGGTAGLTAAVFGGGGIRAGSAAATLAAGVFTGAVALDANGVGLTVSSATVNSGGAITVGGGVTLGTTVLNAGGEITYDGGVLGGAYTQNGGALLLDAGLAMGAGNSFAGGEVRAGVTGAFSGANVAAGGTLSVTAAGGKVLTVSGVGFGAGGVLRLGGDVAGDGDVLLSMASHGAGTVVLEGNGGISGAYALSGTGELVLAGGSAGTGVITLSGGVVRSDVAGGEIAVSTINGGVALKGTGGNSLTVAGAEILGTAGMTFEGDVTLKNTELTGGVLTLDANVGLSGTYAQGSGGTLVLAGGEIGTDAGGLRLSGGAVRSDIAGGALSGAAVDGDVSLATGSGGKLLLGGAGITGGAAVTAGAGVTIDGAVLTDGEIVLGTDSVLTGNYAQGADGVLVLAGGEVALGDGAALSAGAVESGIADAEFAVDFITGGEVTLRTDSASNYLTATGVEVKDGGVLILQDNVTLSGGALTDGEIRLGIGSLLSDSYVQFAGDTALVLDGGDVDALADITIHGGTVKSVREGQTFDNAVFMGDATLTTEGTGSTLGLTGTVIDGGITLTITGDVTMTDTTLRNSTFIADGSSVLDGVYTQSGDAAKLILRGGSTAGIEKARFDGGEIVLETASSALSSASFTGETRVVANGNALSIGTAVVQDGGVFDIVAGVTLGDAELRAGGELTVSGGSVSGKYAQGGGDLVLAGGGLAGADVTLSGGTVKAAADVGLGNAVIDGEVFFGGSGGELDLSGAVIVDGGNAVLGAGSAIRGGGLSAGTITLDGGVLAEYSQSGSGTLVLKSGDTGGVDGGVFSGGTVDSRMDAVLNDIVFDGKVATVASGGGSLVFVDADIRSGSELEIGDDVTLLGDTANGGAGIILSGTGKIDGAYAQSDGGALTLNGGGITGTATFSGGSVHSTVADGKLGGGNFAGGIVIDGDVTAFATGGGKLEIAGADIRGDGANLRLGAGATLVASVLNEGTVTLNEGGALGAGYVQNGGTLALAAGGARDAGGAEFLGGFIESLAKGAELAGAVFTRTVDFITGSGGDLTLSEALIDGVDAVMGVGDGVVLKDSALDRGVVRLEEGGGLGGSFVQRGGELVLAGGDAGTGGVFSGGKITAVAAGSVLDNAAFIDRVEVGAAGADVQLTNARLGEKGELRLGESASLVDGVVGQGRVTLLGGGSLSGTYTQTGGTLHFAGGSAGGAAGAFSGGYITSADAGAKLAGASFANVVGIDAADGALEVTGVTLADSAVVRLGRNVTLLDGDAGRGEIVLEGGSALSGTYRQEGGVLTFAGGGAAGAAVELAGGVVRAAAGGAGGVLSGARILAGSGVAVRGDDGAAMTLNGASVEDGAVTMLVGGALVGGTVVSGGVVVLDGGGVTGQYSQSGGTLLLRTDTFNADVANFTGGAIHVGTAKAMTLRGADFIDNSVVMTAVEGGSLVIEKSLVDGGDVFIDHVVTMETAIDSGSLHNSGGAVTLTRLAEGGGSYAQSAGTLALADGVETAGGRVTLSGGSVFAAAGGAATLHGATVLAGDVVVAGETGGLLGVRAVRVDGGELRAGANALLTDASVLNGGVVTILDKTVLAGATTLTARGGVRFANRTPGNRATIARLAGSDGILHISVDAATGATDYYVVEDSEGKHGLFVSAAGVAKNVDVLTDVRDGAEYYLASEGYGEAGAHLVENTLSSRVEADASRIWSLNREVKSLSSSAEGAGNAPGISLAQATAGMNELGRHFRTLRDFGWRARDIVLSDGSGEDSEEGVSSESLCGACPDDFVPPPLFNVWAAGYAHHMTVDALGSASMDMQGLDIGFEKRFDALAGGSLYVGAVMGGQWLNDLSMKQSYSENGTGNGTALSLGAYASWMGGDGWFADVAAGHYWTDADLVSHTPAGDPVRYNPRRGVFAVSAEAGRRFALGDFGKWYVEPLVGLMGTWTGGDRFGLSNGLVAASGASSALQGTAAVTLGYAGTRASPYLEAALVHGFGGKTSVMMAGTRLRADMSGTRARAGLGLRIDLTEHLSLSVDGAYERGPAYRDVNGNVGIDFSW